MTLEDENDNANLGVWEKLFGKYRKEIIQPRLFMAEGKLQVEGEVIHLVVWRYFNLTLFIKRINNCK
jgi:error-prone DNA polymerase